MVEFEAFSVISILLFLLFFQTNLALVSFYILNTVYDKKFKEEN